MAGRVRARCDRVARLLVGVCAKAKQIGLRWRPVGVNGQPGVLIFDSQDRLIGVMALGSPRRALEILEPSGATNLGLRSRRPRRSQ
ncbi:MAG: hypothetical protein ACR2NN_03850 [Bryobacteraceae bacterium]